MGQQLSTQNHPEPQYSNRYLQSRKVWTARQTVEHEGILLLRPVPFKNCIQIQSQTMPMFLQNVEANLGQLIASRLYSNKLFPLEDICKLVENVVYTLAYLQSLGIIYRDMSAEWIFYDKGNFKLLPNQLIPMTTYQKFKLSFLKNQAQDQASTYPSPQMIIAHRCLQNSITDQQILNKTNIFLFGMVLLEAATLLPSRECYDPQNYDILDNVVTQRITLVQQFYDEKMARIVANMLDYDYTQRMDPRELSIWINRQLNELKTKEDAEQKLEEVDKRQNSTVNSISKSNISNSRAGSKNGFSSDSQPRYRRHKEKNEPKKAKKNTIYIEQDESLSRNSDKNKIYLHPSCDESSQTKSRIEESKLEKYVKYSGTSRQLTTAKDSIEEKKLSAEPHRYERSHNIYQNYSHHKALAYQNQAPHKKAEELQTPKAFDSESRWKKENRYKQYLKPESSYAKPLQPKNVISFGNERHQSVLQDKQLQLKNSRKLCQDSNALEHLRSEKKYSIKANSFNSCQNSKDGDHSINKIKEEIEKSKKLIKEFRKNQTRY